jgi:hypothetical protein
VAIAALAGAEEYRRTRCHVAGGLHVEGVRVERVHKSCQSLQLSLRQEVKGRHIVPPIANECRDILLALAAQGAAIAQWRRAICALAIATVADRAMATKFNGGRSDGIICRGDRISRPSARPLDQAQSAAYRPNDQNRRQSAGHGKIIMMHASHSPDMSRAGFLSIV